MQLIVILEMIHWPKGISSETSLWLWCSQWWTQNGKWFGKTCKGTINKFLSKKAIGAKPTKVTLFTMMMIFYGSEKSIHSLRPFCCQLLCHSSVVKCTSSPLH